MMLVAIYKITNHKWKMENLKSQITNHGCTVHCSPGAIGHASRSPSHATTRGCPAHMTFPLPAGHGLRSVQLRGAAAAAAASVIVTAPTARVTLSYDADTSHPPLARSVSKLAGSPAGHMGNSAR